MIYLIWMSEFYYSGLWQCCLLSWAWTAVGVTELVLPQLMLEIRATAVVGSGSSDR